MNPNTRAFIDYCRSHRFRRNKGVNPLHDLLVNSLVANPGSLGFENPWYSTRETYFAFSLDRSVDLDFAGNPMEVLIFTPDLIVVDSAEVPWFGEVKSTSNKSFRMRSLVYRSKLVVRAFEFERVGFFGYRASQEKAHLRYFDLKVSDRRLLPRVYAKKELFLPKGFVAKRRFLKSSD